MWTRTSGSARASATHAARPFAPLLRLAELLGVERRRGAPDAAALDEAGEVDGRAEDDLVTARREGVSQRDEGLDVTARAVGEEGNLHPETSWNGGRWRPPSARRGARE